MHLHEKRAALSLECERMLCLNDEAETFAARLPILELGYTALH
jgi:hypothetical protein